MIAVKGFGLSHSPKIIVSRPASMRLAIAISPSRLSSSTAPISRRYIRTGSSVRSMVSFFLGASGGGGRAVAGVDRLDLVVIALVGLAVFAGFLVQIGRASGRERVCQYV